jgi:hypothetical protein
MTIKVTDEAKNELTEITKESGFKNPAIKLKFNGFG